MGTFSSGGSTMGEYKPVEQNFVIPTSNSTYIGVKSNYSYYDIETLDVSDLTLSDEHKFESGTKNDKDFDIHGTVVSYNNCDLIPVYPDRDGV